MTTEHPKRLIETLKLSQPHTVTASTRFPKRCGNTRGSYVLSDARILVKRSLRTVSDASAYYSSCT